MGERLHRVSGFFRRVNVDRILVIFLIGALVVLGWTQNQTSKSYHNFTNCTVDYFVKDRVAGNATTQASRKLVAANNKAFKTVPDFFTLLVASAQPKKPPTPAERTKTTKQLIKLADQISSQFNKSNDKYQDYLTAIKENPRPPDPTKFCKEK